LSGPRPAGWPGASAARRPGFAGTVRAAITAAATGQKWQWEGTAGFVLADGGERLDGSFEFDYTVETTTVGSATYTVPRRTTVRNCAPTGRVIPRCVAAA
jgi:hypothetical protein